MQGSVKVIRSQKDGSCYPVKTSLAAPPKPQNQEQNQIAKDPKNKDLNQHLSRVMKLIQTREATKNAVHSPDIFSNQNSFHRNLNSDIIDRQNMKRSVTPHAAPGGQINNSVSVIESNKQSLQFFKGVKLDDDAKGSRLGQLRIVKSIHHSQASQARDSMTSVVVEEASEFGILSNDALSSKIIKPMGYFSQQQKRSFVPDPSSLILQGQQKPKLNRNRKNFLQKQRYESRDSGCQTSPINSAGGAKNSSTKPLLSPQTKNKFQAEDDDDDASTQKNSLEKLQDVKQGSQNFWDQSAIKVNVPSKKHHFGTQKEQLAKASHEKSTDSAKNNALQQKQRNFKMSLLKISQAKAQDKYFLPQQQNNNSTIENLISHSTSQHGGNRYSKRESQTRVSTSTAAFQSFHQQAPSSKMHTAMLQSKRQTRTRERFLSYKEQDLQQDIFSLNNQSILTPNSDAEQQRHHLEIKSSVEQAIFKANLRARSSLMHVTGAFKDRGSKPVSTDQDLQRNILRGQLNKTQQFFMQANRSREMIENGQKFSGDIKAEQTKQEIEKVIGKEKVDMIRIKVKESIEAIDESMMASLKPLPLVNNQVPIMHASSEDLPETERINRQSNQFKINSQESIVSFLDKKHGSDILLKDKPNVSDDYLDEDSIKFEKRAVHHNTSHKPSSEAMMEEALEMMIGGPQQQRGGLATTQCSSLIPPPSAMNNFPSKISSQVALHQQHQQQLNAASQADQQWPSSSTNKQKIQMIEARLIKRITGELDKKEYQIYQRHGLQSEITYNASDLELYDLMKHPEWCDVGREVMDIYLTILENFNDLLIAKNYFNREENFNSQQNSQAVIKRQSLSSQARQSNQRSQFMDNFMSRLRNIFQQQNRLQQESLKRLTHLKEENDRLQNEVNQYIYKEKKVKDTQEIINELINQYFQLGKDRNLKSRRVKEAEDYLSSKPLSEMIQEEEHQTISKLQYSNVLSRLEQVVIDMQMPSIMQSGTELTIRDHQFDPDYKDNLKKLFSDPIQSAQYCAALSALTMVYKDTQFEDIGIQAQEQDIDFDLSEEIKFLKENILRLQSEINTMKTKMQANEKAMKTANREKQDAVLTAKVYEETLAELKQNDIRSQNMVVQYKIMHGKTQSENDNLIIQVSKLGNQVEKMKKNDKLAEKVVDKQSSLSGRKDILIRDLDGLVEMLECYCTEDQAKKIAHVRNLKAKIEMKNEEVKKAVWEFQRRDNVVITRSTQQQRGAAQASNKFAGYSESKNDGFGEQLDPEMLEYERAKNMAESPSRRTRQTSKSQVGRKDLQTPNISEIGSDRNNTEESLQKKKRGPTTKESKADDSSEINLTDEEENENQLMRTYRAKNMTNKSDSLKSLNDIKESDDEQSMSISSHDDEVQQAQITQPTIRRRKNVRDFKSKFKQPKSPASNSDQTERMNSEQYLQVQNNETNFQIKGFNNRDIIVNSSQGERKKTTTVQVIDQCVQTDTEQFFRYIFDFLAELERRLNSGEISIDDILAMGRMARGVQNAEEGKDFEGSKAWGYESPGKQKQQYLFSIQELKDCLNRLRSLSSHGGDLFFVGIAKTMVTKPIIPQSYNPVLVYHREEEEEAAMYAEEQNKMVRLEMENLAKMTRVRHSTGGGSGAAKNPPSPSKASKASISIGSSPILQK